MGKRITNFLLIQDYANGSVVFRVETEIAREEGTDEAFDSFIMNDLPAIASGEASVAQAENAAEFLTSRVGDGHKRKTARNVMRAALGLGPEH